MNNFYNDWATTLHTELSYHQAVSLGIISVKGGRKSVEEDTDTPDGDEE